MAYVVIRDSINMDNLHLRDALGAEISWSTPTSLALNIPRGAVTSFPQYSPSNLTGNVILHGQGLTYDANDQLTGGVVTDLGYSAAVDNGHWPSLDISGLSINGATLYSWFSGDRTQEALRTMLSGNDVIGSEDLYGSGGAVISIDLIRGYGGDDTIDAGGGGDVVYGGDGNDQIHAGFGNDTVSGGTGNDTIYGSDHEDSFSDGTNRLQGDEGSDSIAGASASDYIDGGAGDDTLSGDGRALTTSGDVFRVSPGSDLIQDFRVAEGDKLSIAAGVTYTVAQNGADTVVSFSDGARVTLAGVGAASLSGGWIAHNAAWSPGPGDPPPPSGAGPTGTTFTFGAITLEQGAYIRPIDKVVFSAGTATQGSVLYGDNTVSILLGDKASYFTSSVTDISKAGNLIFPDGSAFIIGWREDNSLTGRSTGDALFGGEGNDTLDGAAGGDLLQGNQGRDRLIGGEGSDTVYGGQGDDTLLLGDGSNFGQANRGADSLVGGQGADTLLGGQDNDTITGEAGADFLNGNRGDDSLSGGAGNDTLVGEFGADVLVGGAGADVFRASLGEESDKVLDFNRAEGDRLLLDGAMTYTVSQVGADVVVKINVGDQITLVGVSLSSLTGDWIG